MKAIKRYYDTQVITELVEYLTKILPYNDKEVNLIWTLNSQRGQKAIEITHPIMSRLQSISLYKSLE